MVLEKLECPLVFLGGWYKVHQAVRPDDLPNPLALRTQCRKETMVACSTTRANAVHSVSLWMERYTIIMQTVKFGFQRWGARLALTDTPYEIRQSLVHVGWDAISELALLRPPIGCESPGGGCCESTPVGFA